MNREDLKQLVLEVATHAERNGPGWAQEGVVLRDVGVKLSQKGQFDLRM